MLPGRAVEHAAAGGAGDQALLDQEGLDHVFHRVARFRKAGGERFNADRATAIDIGDHHQVTPVHRVEAEAIDLQSAERGISHAGSDFGLAGGSREIAHTAQQPAGDARRATGPRRNLARPIGGERQFEQPRSAGDDLFQLIDGVEIEAQRDTETIAQRCRQQPGAGGSANQGERRQIDAHAARRWAFADHDVQHPVFHGRIEDFLHRWRHAVDFIDEQHVMRFEIGEDGREIAGLGDDRT